MYFSWFFGILGLIRQIPFLEVKDITKKIHNSSFLGGAALLALSTALVKVIGAIYKIPLGNIIGSEGMTYFNVAYSIYNVLLAISTAGLPLAISKLTSQAHALGKEQERRRIFTTSVALFSCLGLVSALLMFFGAEELSYFMNQAPAFYAIRAMSPAVFCVCMLACMRGYTQGQGDMTPSAMSQVIEAICKLTVGLSLAIYLLGLGYGYDVAVGGAIFGVTAGMTISMCYMGVYLFRRRKAPATGEQVSSRGLLLKQILVLGIPITLSNSAMSIISLIDTKTVLGRLATIPELANSAATLFGQYTFGMDLINLPPAFVLPVTMSLIPFAVAAIAKADHQATNRIISSALRVVTLLALPAGIGLSVLAGPILQTLYPAQLEDALAATPHLRILGIACIFICLMTVSNAVLQAYGKERIPICSMVVGGCVKIVLNLLLVGNATINIAGAPISTLCCYMVITGINLFFIWKHSPQRPNYLKLFCRPLVAALLMGGSAWGGATLVLWVLGDGYRANVLATMVGVGLGVVVYGILVIALRLIGAEDVKSLPKGEKLIRILHLK